MVPTHSAYRRSLVWEKCPRLPVQSSAVGPGALQEPLNWLPLTSSTHNRRRLDYHHLQITTLIAAAQEMPHTKPTQTTTTLRPPACRLPQLSRHYLRFHAP